MRKAPARLSRDAGGTPDSWEARVGRTKASGWAGAAGQVPTCAAHRPEDAAQPHAPAGAASAPCARDDPGLRSPGHARPGWGPAGHRAPALLRALQTASPVPRVLGRVACTRRLRKAGFRALSPPARPRAVAGHSQPARCSAGLESQPSRRSSCRAPALPGCGLGLPQRGSLKGPRPPELHLRLRLRLRAASTPGQSGRGPVAGSRADLQGLEPGSWEGVRSLNCRGGLRGPGRAPSRGEGGRRLAVQSE